MADSGVDQKEVASVFVEQEDGGYLRVWCKYSDLFAADIAVSKSRKYRLDVYTSEGLAPKSRMSVDAALVFRANNDDANGAQDMTALTYLEEPNMLQCLQSRYDHDNIYTNIAGVLVAVNPWKQLDVYSVDYMTKYRGQRRLDLLPPHIFAVAEKAYQELRNKRENQSMICCGESGSGKTVSTKMLMRYLANITVISASNEAAAHQTSLVEQQVLQANPLLEAFGNAKTLMNENSSRFAKFTKLFVSNEEGRIMGAHTETYLLEKSRVVHPNKGERNFHVFYQVAAGMGAQLGLPAAEKLSFLNSGNCITLKNVDDAANFKELCDCMSVLDFTKEDQQVVFGLVAAILLLGNVRFDSDSVSAARRSTVAPGAAQPSMTLSADSKDCIARAATFIGVDVAALEKRLTSRRIKISGKEEIERTLEGEEAVSNRDSLIKSLYNALFGWIVSKINSVLYRGEVDTVNWIGLLDVFGFECFENNSFEQFCINFANEKLQEFFNSYILKSEQAEYRKEGIFWTPIQIPDNTDVISLISSKPSGILCLLDSACIMPKGGPETFAANLFAVHGNHPRLLPANSKNVPALKLTANPATALEAKKEKDRQQRLNVPGAGKDKANSFYVRHYAGYVVYDPQHFLGKNADATNPDTVVLFSSSQHDLVKSLFAEEMELLTLTQQGTRFVSVGSTFSKQLAALMETLQQTTPYFIRCASPNNLQQAGKFVWTYVKPQLRCGGLVEALRMLKFGYPSRVKYDVIFERYGQHLQPLPPNLNHRNFCEAVLAAFGLGRSQYQLGLTKVFFRPGKQEFLDTIFRRSDEPLTPEIHAFIRKWLIKRRWQRAVQSVMTHMWCSKRLAHIRSAHMFRHAIRIGMIYLQTLRKYLTKIRRLGKARKNAVTTIQSWFRHSYRRRALASNVNTRIKNKRKDRFKMMGLDAKSADELNMLRIQMQSIKKKEEAEKKKLEEAQKEAQQKELQLQKVMEEKQREMERLQREMENLKQKDIEAAQQAEMVAELKMRTQKLREENERNAQAARMIMLQREADAKKKQEEIEKMRAETERKLKEHEQAQEELKRQKEEERKRREEDLAVLKMQTESMREEHESRAKEALRLLQEREEANRRKEEELAKLKQHAEKLKAEHVQETEELRQQREAERLQKEEEQARLKSEIDRMKLELDAEAVAFQNSLRAREEENKRKERELAVIKMEAERVKMEQEEFIKQLQTQREQERQRKEEELRRMQQEAADTQKYYEDQAAQQARLLAEREEENRRKEEVLAQLAAAAAEERRVHEDRTREAAEKLKELEQTSAAEKERLRLEREEALRQHEATLVRLQEEGKKELEEQLRRRDEAAQSAQESMKAQHESAVQQLQLHILSLEQEIENLNDRADRAHASHVAEVAELTAALRAQEQTTRDRDLKIFDLRTEVSNMKKAHAELNAISERLLAEAQEEHRRTRAEHKQAVNQMRDANSRLQQQYDKLQRDYNDVVAHFQQEMQSASESKALSDKRRNTRQKSAMPNPDTFREEMSKLRLELSRSRMISTAEMRPDFSALLSASITAQKGAKDFEASLKTKAGWLMKRRPGNRILGKGPKLRYHVLEGGVMSWYKDEKDAPRPGVAGKPLGSLEIKHYEFVKYDAEEKGGDTVIYMVTREGRSKEELELLVPPQKELPSGAAVENLLEWVHEINKRNAVMNYLDVIFAQDQRSKGCRELLEFVTDSTATELRVENKVVDVHSALTALLEPLKHRKGFKKLILNNIALSDPSVQLFADIIAKNTEIEHIELTWNLLTAKGAQALATALKSNKSVRTVLLDHNSIGDQGLTALASALPLHKTIYRLSLTANKISDEGVKDFAESLIQSGADHVFPLLEFAENLIGNAGAAALARLCAVNRSITRLNLRSNLVSDDGVIALAETLKSKKSGLGDVRLSNNQISNRGVIALSDAMNVTNQEVSFDLSHNRLVSRSGLTSLVSAEFPLEFALLKVVRGVEDPVAENARLIREKEREQQAALFVQEMSTPSRPSVPSRISVSTAPFAPRRAAAMTVAIPEEPVTPVRLSVASRHFN